MRTEGDDGHPDQGETSVPETDLPPMRIREGPDTPDGSDALVPGLPERMARPMSYGEFEREMMRRDMEEAEKDFTPSGFEEWIRMMLWSLAVLLAGCCGVFLLDWIEHFGRGN